MIAYAINGEQLPLLNGFPLRLVVPGWYSIYWVKMLSDIEVLAKPDANYWTATAYRIPDTPRANIKPGDTVVNLVPIIAWFRAPSSRILLMAPRCMPTLLPSSAASHSAATQASCACTFHPMRA